MDILKVNKICKNYPHFSLKDVSFTLQSGKIMGFIGRNGAGKTTTIKAIMDLIHLDGGNIEVFGNDLKNNVIFIKKQIGFVMNGVDVFPAKKIKAIALVYSKFYDNWNQDRFIKYCHVFKLDLNKKFNELSQGMKTKFLLALALSHDAKLLILDEPTSGLDPISREELLDLFLKIIKNEDRAILFSTHITSDLDKVADDITYIRNGEIVLSQPKSALLAKYQTLSGNVKDLKDEYKSYFISYKIYSDTFKGLILASDAIKFTGMHAKLEKATIDDIIIFLEKEVNQDEEFII